MFVSARSSDDDQIHALSIGGDDYVRKPFSLGVLLAKIRRILDRRLAQTTDPSPTAEGYDDGHLTVDPGSGRVFVAGSEVTLTSLEHRLLGYLVRHQGRVVPKVELFEQVWGPAVTGDSTQEAAGT